jgi:hypothetical protein
VADFGTEFGGSVNEVLKMRILSEDEAANLLGVSDLTAFIEEVDWKYPDPVPIYRLPKDAGKKVGVARIIANCLLDHESFLLWVTTTAIWPSSEHCDLFNRYRMSFGEHRSLHEAPVHLLESEDRDRAISLLSLGLFFFWDLEIVATDRSIAISISHDDWMEIRHNMRYGTIATELEKHLSPLFQ